MKKFISMFAFVAAIVLGAFTLASCGGDDDEEPAEKHTYKFEVTINSYVDQTRHDPEFIKIADEWKKESEAKLPSFTATEKEAEQIYKDKINEFDAPVKAKLKALRAQFNDDEHITFVITLSSEKITSWKLMEWKSR